VGPSTCQGQPGDDTGTGVPLGLAVRSEAPPSCDNYETAPLRDKLILIHDRLARCYGLPVNDSPMDPTSELIHTILSQNTNDKNRDRAFARLRSRFPTWQEVVDAPEAAISEAIRPGGLAAIKAPRIQAALRSVHEVAGTYDLSFICEMEVEAARRWLLAIRGVGPKTAACVLLFSCGKPVMPVDTHILRLSRRLALIPASASAEQAHDIFGAAARPDQVFSLHINLIRHGRAVCHARQPQCPGCVLNDICSYPYKRLPAQSEKGQGQPVCPAPGNASASPDSSECASAPRPGSPG